ncbi:MAG TPA: glycosyltransferase family 87 protein [Thermoleophilaceae bacterium]|nr:glycosyltransferase family 87 protein [Thermoleophilaceae bacterium]
MKARPAIPLFVGAALLSALTMLNGIQPNDEGLMLQAASRIAHGQVPYRDFWWFYPPGQPYLLAVVWKVFGPSLLTWRIVRVLSDAAVATLAYFLARRAAPPRLALAVWLAAACAMAFPSGPHPYPIAMACALGALLLFEERPLLAGVLVGVCAAWRLEFAAYLGAGIVIACLVGRRSPLRFAGSAAGAGLVLYLPVVIAAGIGRSWDLIVKYPLTTFSDYQSLPFPSDYNGPLNTSSIGGFFTDSAENILHYYLPLALVVGLGAAVVALALRWGRERWWQIAGVVFAGGMAHYLVVRADEFHTAPLAVMLSVLAAWVLAERRALPRIALVPAVVVALAFAYVLAEGIDRRVRTAQDRGVAIDLPVADGVRDRAARVPPLENAVRYVDAHVPRGRPIYVATLRSDLITSGNPLFYVLAQRPNPTRYDIQAPGVVTSAPVQREIVGDLERTRTPIVVRFAAPITAAPEPDRAGRSTGVHVLDEYIAQRYHRVAKYAFYDILARNG